MAHSEKVRIFSEQYANLAIIT